MEDSIDFSLSIKQALILVFVLGISVGFAGGVATTTVLSSPQMEDADTQAAPSNTGNQQPSGTDSQGSKTETIDMSKIDIEGEPALGDKDAPVTIVEYADYQCPFCRKYFTETFSKIKENYIDTGKVRYIYKDFPLPQLGHDNAIEMAEAANCAKDQGKYWEMHDKLYKEQNEISPRRTAKFDAKKIDQWAEEIGLNMSQYNQCMESDKYKSEVQQDRREGKTLGVSGTPTFFINGKKLVGAQPYSRFETVIEQELN
ncbi:MAG: DsbA family protein [Candidatus Nanohalobium sp.]